MEDKQVPIFPHIVGKYSLLLGKIFPYFMGTNSHKIREYFPTICGTKRICTSPIMVDYLFIYSCYRLTGKDTVRNESQQRSACRCAKSTYIIINQWIESKNGKFGVKSVKDVKGRLFFTPSPKTPVKQSVTNREGCEGKKLNFITELYT